MTMLPADAAGIGSSPDPSSASVLEKVLRGAIRFPHRRLPLVRLWIPEARQDDLSGLRRWIVLDASIVAGVLVNG